MQLKYRGSREELQSLKQGVDQQLERIKERRKKLTEQETELKAEEERLEKLKSANSKEAEQILKTQESKLKDAISKEKKTLSALKELVFYAIPFLILFTVSRSRSIVEGEIKELNQRKVSLKLSVEELGRKESEHRFSVEQLDRKIKEHRKSFLKITQEDQETGSEKDNWPAPVNIEVPERRLSAKRGSSLSPRQSPTTVQFREEGDGKPPLAEEGVDQGIKGSRGGGVARRSGSGEPELQESWMMRGGRDESPDTAMDILDLEPPPTASVSHTG